MPHRSIHRCSFLAAGLYNIAWGTYASVDPQWMFRFAGMPPDNHPEIFACLGMVLALYGVLYLVVAYNPERGAAIAAVGLAGKVFGPIGWFKLVATGVWPLKTIVLCLPNDLIWWLPFGWYLFDVLRRNTPPAPDA